MSTLSSAELSELYQELIIEHGRRPRNFGSLSNATAIKEGYNPLCGDRVTIYIEEAQEKIIDIRFEGSGCAISQASTSLMTEALKGKTRAEISTLFDAFHQVVMGEKISVEGLGKLAALAGVAAYPMRVKCATLCWHTLMAMLKQTVGAVDIAPVSTE